MSLVYLLETTANIDGGGTVPIRLSTGKGYNHPSAPGSGFDGGLSENTAGLGVQTSVFAGGEFGAGSLDYGGAEIVNEDGEFDAWLDYGWGNAVTLKIGGDDEAYSSFTKVMTARVAGLSPDVSLFTLSFESRLVELDNPASPATYAGTNSGTTGLESTGDALGGQKKLRTAGRLRALSPDLLNASKRMYGWNHGEDGLRKPTFAVTVVRFQGAAWSFGQNFATAPALAGSSPAQGSYNTCLAESLLMMGGSSALNGAVTIDLTIEATAAQRYAGAQLSKWLQDAGIDIADISSADVAALNALAPYEIGIAVRDESYQEICDQIAASVAAYYVPDRNGVYRFGQVQAPGGAPAATFKRFDYDSVAELTEGELKSIKPVSGGAEWVPAKEVRVKYNRSWTPLDASSIAAAVSEADKAALAQEWRVTPSATSAAIAAKYANSRILEVETLLADQAGAHAIRDVLAALYSTQRREFEAEVEFGPDFAGSLDHGKAIKITHPKLGLSGGKPFRVHGQRLRDRIGSAILRLWG